MKIPFFDLKEQYQSIKPEIDSAIDQVHSSGTYVGGKIVSDFETQFAQTCGIPYCVGLGNATDGLFLSLKALGVGAGDEVITPAWSWISSAEVITLAGATPVFADVDPALYTLSKNEVEQKVTSKTKAVIAVHLYGQAAEIKALKNLCDQRGLLLIEDCSQAHLTNFEDNQVGTFGHCGVFSFYPTKNLGAYGDGGCVITEDDKFAQLIRRWANHGGLSKDEHQFEGTNSRLDALQAAVLKVKLKYLSGWTEKRIAHADSYSKQLGRITEIVIPSVRPGSKHTFHQYVIQVQNRQSLREYLLKKGIETMIHFPKALPFEPAYNYLNHRVADFPGSAALQDKVLSLPIYPELTEDQIDYVCACIKTFYGS